MKKKVLSLALVVVLALVAIGSATLAYFTDTETAKNTFTLGKVDIDLLELDNYGSDFQNGQKLIPGSNSANAIAKNVLVTVKDDSEDSWVWVEILIPAELYNSKTETNENNNALHYNQFLNYLQEYSKDSTNPNAVEAAKLFKGDHQWSTLKYVGESADGKYSILRTTHKDVVKAGETTSPALNQIYMDDDVYYDEATSKYMIPKDGKSAGAATEFVEYAGDWEVLVNAYAVQAAGVTLEQAIAQFNK